MSLSIKALIEKHVEYRKNFDMEPSWNGQDGLEVWHTKHGFISEDKAKRMIQSHMSRTVKEITKCIASQA